MAKHNETMTTNNAPVVNTFNVDEFLGNTVGLSQGSFRDKFKATLTENDVNADLVNAAFDKFLKEHKLAIVHLPNARRAPTAVIAKPSETTLNKERWFTYTNLFDAREMGNGVVSIVAPVSYLTGKVIGYEATAKASTTATFKSL